MKPNHSFLLFVLFLLLGITETSYSQNWPHFWPARFNFMVGNGLYSVTIGDFDEDGHQDLAVTNFVDNDVAILSGKGDGSFGTASFYDEGNGPRSVAIGDFNNDGHQDLVVANYFSDDVAIMLGNGDGSFGTASFFGAGRSPISIAIGDFDEDGHQDLVVANCGSSDVSILSGNGDGSFGTAAFYGAAIGPFSVTIGDFDEDEHQDLAVANHGDWIMGWVMGGHVSVLLGNVEALFETSSFYGAGESPISVAIGNFDEDGH